MTASDSSAIVVFIQNSAVNMTRSDTTEVASHVANKTGSLDRVRNDVGIVYTKDGPIVISAFTYDNADASWSPENEAELLIARVARTIVGGWAPHGLGEETAGR